MGEDPAERSDSGRGRSTRRPRRTPKGPLVPQPPADLVGRPRLADRVEGAPSWLLPVIEATIFRIVAAVFVSLLIVWAVGELRHLIGIVLLAFFFSLALDPGVTWLHEHRGMRRGAATGLIYIGLVAFLVVLVVLLIPLGVRLASHLGDRAPSYVDSANQWFDETFGAKLVPDRQVTASATQMSGGVGGWLKSHAGDLFGFAQSGIGLLFDFLTLGLFTFYLTANAPNVRRALASRLSPSGRRRLLWSLDVAVAQTGGYFYSRLLLAAINATLGFVVLIAVGVPTQYAFPLAAFQGLVAEFIPAVGTYIGAAIPVLFVLAEQGFVQAIVVVVYVFIYQQLENAWLSPRISAQTMSLNAGVAFGSALAGGALAGPIGAFVALPVAGMITAFLGAWSRASTEEDPSTEGGAVAAEGDPS